MNIPWSLNIVCVMLLKNACLNTPETESAVTVQAKKQLQIGEQIQNLAKPLKSSEKGRFTKTIIAWKYIRKTYNMFDMGVNTIELLNISGF